MIVNAAPVASSAISNVPHTGGAAISLLGLNFALSDFTATALLSGGLCTTTSWTSKTMLYCISRPLLRGLASRLVILSISSVISTGLRSFSFDAATLTHTTPHNLPSSASALSLSIYGLNFGYSEHTASVAFDGALCGTSSWSSDTSVVCQLGASMASSSRSGSGLITVAGLAGTAEALFSYDAPVLSSGAGNIPSVGQSIVTVTGLNFGFSEYTVTSAVAGFACETTLWSSTTSVACVIVSLASRDGTGQLTMNSVVGTGLFLAFTFDGMSSHVYHRDAVS